LDPRSVRIRERLVHTYIPTFRSAEQIGRVLLKYVSKLNVPYLLCFCIYIYIYIYVCVCVCVCVPIYTRVVSICRHVGSENYHGADIAVGLERALQAERASIHSELAVLSATSSTEMLPLLPSTKKTDLPHTRRVQKKDHERAKVDRYRSLIRAETDLWLARSRSEMETRFYHTAPVRIATQDLGFDLERLLNTYDDHVWASLVHTLALTPSRTLHHP
jgi:hypothetical protein